MSPRSERGLTLTELVVVGVLATLVMLALTGFYFNSQRTWLEGSSQALTQREATLALEHLADDAQSFQTKINFHAVPPFYWTMLSRSPDPAGIPPCCRPDRW